MKKIFLTIAALAAIKTTHINSMDYVANCGAIAAIVAASKVNDFQCFNSPGLGQAALAGLLGAEVLACSKLVTNMAETAVGKLTRKSNFLLSGIAGLGTAAAVKAASLPYGDSNNFTALAAAAGLLGAYGYYKYRPNQRANNLRIIGESLKSEENQLLTYEEFKESAEAFLERVLAEDALEKITSDACGVAAKIAFLNGQNQHAQNNVSACLEELHKDLTEDDDDIEDIEDSIQARKQVLEEISEELQSKILKIPSNEISHKRLKMAFIEKNARNDLKKFQSKYDRPLLAGAIMGLKYMSGLAQEVKHELEAIQDYPSINQETLKVPRAFLSGSEQLYLGINPVLLANIKRTNKYKALRLWDYPCLFVPILIANGQWPF